MEWRGFVLLSTQAVKLWSTSGCLDGLSTDHETPTYGLIIKNQSILNNSTGTRQTYQPYSEFEIMSYPWNPKYPSQVLGPFQDQLTIVAQCRRDRDRASRRCCTLRCSVAPDYSLNILRTSKQRHDQIWAPLNPFRLTVLHQFPWPPTLKEI